MHDLKPQTVAIRACAALLLLCLSACAQLSATRDSAQHCVAKSDDGSVTVMSNLAYWHEFLTREDESVMQGVHVGAFYKRIRLSDDPSVARDFGGLADDPSLYVTFGDRFERRNDLRRNPPRIEIYGEVRVGESRIRQPADAKATVRFEGSALNRLFAETGDLEVALYDSSGAELQHARVARARLVELESMVRTLSSELEEKLRDPARYCNEDESAEDEIIL